VASRDRCEQERRASVQRAIKRNRRLGIRPEELKRHAWTAYIWRKYGLTPHDVALMWDEQDGLCPICRADLTTKVWAIEHRHVKGFVRMTPEEKIKHFRGLTCGWCNHRVLSMCERAGRARIEGIAIYLGWATSLGWTPE